MATHTCTPTTALSTAPQCAEHVLALQMLDRLRHHVWYSGEAPSDIDLAEARVRPDRLLPPDKAAFAIQLAFALALHFPTVEALMESKAFIVIRAAETDDRWTLIDVLYEIAVRDGARVALNPTRNLENDDRLVIVADVSTEFSRGSTRAASEAARRGLPLVCIVSPAAKLPDALSGPDFTLELPPISAEMLQLTFAACHLEGTSDDVRKLAVTGTLTVGDLAAHIRSGRPIVKCIAGLRHAVGSRDKGPTVSKIRLKDLAGYGAAQTWGLELAEDFAIWRQGGLGWEDVDHRAAVLAGPPGTGKTSFASVLAATLEIPLVISSVAEWNGHDNLSGTLKRMQAVFDEAFAKAPCVLLIDELDGISSREAISGRYAEYWTQIVNLMLELVTRAMSTPGVIVVGATNHVERIDPALTRAGRLDQIIRIEPPDAEAIAAILARYAGPTIPSQDVKAIAGKLVGRTGADIEKLVRSAKASARRAGHSLSASDLLEGVFDPLDGLPAQTRRRIAIYRSGQFVAGEVLGLIEVGRQNVQSIERSLVNALGRDRFPTEQVCNDMLTMIMAGRAAEEIVLGEASVYGAGSSASDLALATGLARDLEMASGFGESGLVYLDDPGLVRILPAMAVSSIRRRIDAAMMRASALLLEKREELETTASRVMHGSGSNDRRQHLGLLH